LFEHSEYCRNCEDARKLNFFVREADEINARETLE